MKQILIATLLLFGINSFAQTMTRENEKPSKTPTEKTDAAMPLVQGQRANIDTSEGLYADINGVKLHYKKIGTRGDVLLLLHGSLQSMIDWKRQLTVLGSQYIVYVLDTRGHGRSTFADVPHTYNLLADDVLKFMDAMKIDSALFVGFGDGGITGMTIAMQHPEKVRKLVAIGANSRADSSAVYQNILNKVKAWETAQMTEYIKQNFVGYPNMNSIPQFTARMKKMLLSEPNFSADDMAKIKCPVLFMTGDHDVIKVSHTAEMFGQVPNGYMAVVPGSKHYPTEDKPSIVNQLLMDFLSKRFVKVNRFN